jgi:uncharacterized Zn finger protein
VSELVARFQLRRRASTPVFAAGVRLARQGAVHIHEMIEDVVRATVDDIRPAEVELRVRSGRLDGYCSWAEGDEPCLHQVAVAHVLWLRDRGRSVR